MKHYLKLFSSLFIFSLLMGNVEAQTRTKIKTHVPKFVEQNFGTPSAVTDITDVADSNRSYNSVKSLVDKHVTLTYDDNTFRGNEPIRRGDFLVALNSSLDAIKNVAVENGIDNSANVNTNNATTDNTNTVNNANANPSANANANTNIANGTNSINSNQFTDVAESSVYYPAIQALIQKGISVPFSESKKLNPGAPMSEKEVYDILNQVFNYDKTGMNPYATSMTRNKFALVLNNAVSNKVQEEYTMIDQKNAEAELLRQQEKTRLANEMAQQEQMRKDSLNSAYQAEQQEIEKKALEAQSKKKHRK